MKQRKLTSTLLVLGSMALVAATGCSKLSTPTGADSNAKQDQAAMYQGLKKDVAGLAKGEMLVVEYDSTGKETNREILKPSAQQDSGAQQNSGTLKKTLLLRACQYICPNTSSNAQSWGYSAIGVTGMHDNTSLTFPAPFRRDYVINRGSNWVIATANTFPPGTIFTSTYEVSAFLWTDCQNWTKGFTLYPDIKWGTQYVVPELTTDPNDIRVYLSIATVTDGTRIQFPSRQGPIDITVNKGYSSVWNVNQQGTYISANHPIFCIAWLDAATWCRGLTLDPLDVSTTIVPAPYY